VEATVEAAAAAVAANDRAGLLAHIHPSASEARRLVNWAFGEADFTDAKITHLEVLSINDLTSPPTAKVDVKGFVFFTPDYGEDPYGKRFVNITLELRLDAGRWLITGYQWHDDPRG
jgi:nucleotide-binding universal stress UspA family protein